LDGRVEEGEVDAGKACGSRGHRFEKAVKDLEAGWQVDDGSGAQLCGRLELGYEKLCEAL
jgi:hypothetical protein